MQTEQLCPEELEIVSWQFFHCDPWLQNFVRLEIRAFSEILIFTTPGADFSTITQATLEIFSLDVLIVRDAASSMSKNFPPIRKVLNGLDGLASSIAVATCSRT